MSIEHIFPSMPFSSTEEEIVAQCFANPSVQKYLRRMAVEDTKELLALSSTNSSEVLASAHAKIQGKLEVISTLLSIEAISLTPPQE